MLAFERVPREKVSRYGIAAPLACAAEPGAGARTRRRREQAPETPGEVFTLGNLAEKPSLEAAPSNLAVAARYVFSPRLWPHLVQLSNAYAVRGVGGEIQLTDAIRALIRSGAKVLRWELQQQRRYDVGTYETYVEAQLAFTEEEGKHEWALIEKEWKKERTEPLKGPKRKSNKEREWGFGSLMLAGRVGMNAAFLLTTPSLFLNLFSFSVHPCN